MPLFDYKCPHGHVSTISVPTDETLCNESDCFHIARRRFSFGIVHGIPEHFNNSTGQYVNNVRELKDDLKRQSDVESAVTGIDHNYEYLSPADMADASSRGVTTEGLSESALRKVELSL
jgi:hypothetical protein